MYVIKVDHVTLVINVFDHYLSENGNNVDLVITGKDTARIDGGFHTLFEGSLRDCFNYLRRHRYYD